MAAQGLIRNPLAVLGALAAACAGGVVLVYVFNLRQFAFTSFGFEESRYAVVMPSQICSALGSVAAGYVVASRAVRGPALLAIAISAGLILLSQGMLESVAGPMELAVIICALSALGAAATVLGLVAIAQTTEGERAVFMMLALAVPVLFPVILAFLELPGNFAPAYLAALGAGAVAVLLWAPSIMHRAETRLAFAPVGPAPLSVRSAPSQTPQLALLVVAATIISWAAFQAPQLRGAYSPGFDLTGVGLSVGLGVAAMALGETTAARAGAGVIALMFVWTLGGGPGQPAFLAAGFAGSLTDFSAAVLASRYGQPGDMSKRIGALMGLGVALYIPLNLIAYSAGSDGFFRGEGDTTLLLLAAGASLLLLVLLLQLPRARSPGAAW